MTALFVFYLFSEPFSSCKTHELLVLGPTGMAQQGAFIPQCLDSGIYDLVQCDGTSTYCWCVDENGYEEPGTREFGRPNCDERGNIYFSVKKNFYVFFFWNFLSFGIFYSSII